MLIIHVILFIFIVELQNFINDLPSIVLANINNEKMALLITIILFLSVSMLMVSYEAYLAGSPQKTLICLATTITLAILFIVLQGVKLYVNPFNINDGIYGFCLHLAISFHLCHAVIGTLALIVSFTRIILNYFTNKQFLGFEAVLWYWHFVDVV
jgi:cytochrome c oxidase subunit 3